MIIVVVTSYLFVEFSPTLNSKFTIMFLIALFKNTILLFDSIYKYMRQFTSIYDETTIGQQTVDQLFQWLADS